MHDGVEFERRGVPAAPIATRPFINMALATLAAQGWPDYPFAVVSHPMSRLPDDELRQRAEEALPQVVRLLTQS